MRTALGRTGMEVSRIGLGSSYPAPARAFEMAFERGINYFYWGSMRRTPMADAIRRIAPRHRDALVVVVQSYGRVGGLLRRSVHQALRRLRLDRADVLLLGWHNRPPSPRVIDAACSLREERAVRWIALSGHHRPMFPSILDDERFAIWHLRYNAVHRGAEREVFPAVLSRPKEERPGIVTYTTTRWGHLCDPRRTPPGEKTPTGTDCYRFALSHPAVDLVMAGPSSQEQLEQALKALELGAMDEEELAWMRRVGDHIYSRDRTSRVRDGG